VDRAEIASEPPRFPESFGAAPSAAAIVAAAKLIREAQRPCIIAGGGVLRAGATADLVELAECLLAPVYTAWRRFDAFPNQHPLYMGGLPFMPPDLLAPLQEADLILAVGTRLGEFTTKSYSLPASGQRLIHVDMSAEDSGGGWAGADVAIVADAGEAVRAFGRALHGQMRGGEARAEQLAAWRNHFEARTTPRSDTGGSQNGSVDIELVYHDLNRLVPGDASVTCDAGAFGGWLMRYWRWKQPGTFFGPTAGGMGYALPAAIGAKLARSNAPALAFAGDGGFAMTMSEIETAVRLGLSKFVALVFNNNNYGTIRRHQQRQFPGRTVATDLGAIDFAKAAEAMGAAGFRVTRSSDFAATFEAALSSRGPAVIDIAMSRDCLDPWSA
jgi:acetolactate synthase-1/2/3 large subunit